MPSALPWQRVPKRQSAILFSAAIIVFASLLPSASYGQRALPQREQAEQIRARSLLLEDSGRPGGRDQAAPVDTGARDDAFGAQSILRVRPRRSAFQASVENAVFYTDNAALLRENPIDSAFLNTSMALGWRTAITNRVAASVTGRYGIFRYDRLSVLDFQSLDIDASIAIALPAKLEMLVGYGFTQYTSRQDLEEFYVEHVLNVALQRVFELSSTQYIVVGVAGRWSWAEQEAAQRDRYSAYIGYHLQATERLSADLGYRYAFYDYRDAGNGRGDHNHSLSLSLRYDVTNWMNVNATIQGSWNRSNQSVFDYDAMTVGGSLGLSARF